MGEAFDDAWARVAWMFGLEVLDPAIRLVDRRQPDPTSPHNGQAGERAIGMAYEQVPLCEHAECIAGSVIDQMAINVQERGAIPARLHRMR